MECLSSVHVLGIHSPADTADVSKRQKIVNEIYSSEQTYISQLSVIVDVSGLVNTRVRCVHVCGCVSTTQYVYNILTVAG